MKQVVVSLALALCAGAPQMFSESPAHGYPIDPVPFTSVKLTDPFWGQRLEACRNTTVPLAFHKCEETGRYDNFVLAAHPNDTNKGSDYPFDDTDVYKTIEGASYLLQTYPDARLEAYIDSVLTLVAAAQEADGYLNTAFTMNPAHPHSWMSPRKRWDKVENLSHEFYNLGHMIEGAVAHYRATGKRTFLDIAIRYADCVIREIGPAPGQQIKVPGHQIAEMALAKLYLVTGERKYLDQAKFFLDYRGKTGRRDAYSQAHIPVVEQREAVGHAVRAAYMYAGMADVAALTGDAAYINAIDSIWENLVGKKYYITGGIGARHDGESFGDNYELPNEEAYCETCAAIGNVYVNHRLFLLHGDSKYYDVLERTLYNGLISGMSLDGGTFFYPNPLASEGGYVRKPWFGCACCPSNLCRFLPSVPGYVYAVGPQGVYVNLYIGSNVTLDVNGKKVKLSQSGDYVWGGDVSLVVDENRAGQFPLKLRLPGWARNVPVPGGLYKYVNAPDGRGYAVTVNGTPVDAEVIDGYISLTRKWKKGDRIELKFDMRPRVVVADPHVAADFGRVAVERGPIVYCAEWPDNPFDLQMSVVNPATKFVERKSDKFKGGITELAGETQVIGYDGDGNLTVEKRPLTLIPYYAWAHRGEGQMAVWLPSAPFATRSEK